MEATSIGNGSLIVREHEGTCEVFAVFRNRDDAEAVAEMYNAGGTGQYTVIENADDLENLGI